MMEPETILWLNVLALTAGFICGYLVCASHEKM